jgi:SAM-dependent methyltransferase
MRYDRAIRHSLEAILAESRLERQEREADSIRSSARLREITDRSDGIAHEVQKLESLMRGLHSGLVACQSQAEDLKAALEFQSRELDRQRNANLRQTAENEAYHASTDRAVAEIAEECLKLTASITDQANRFESNFDEIRRHAEGLSTAISESTNAANTSVGNLRAEVTNLAARVTSISNGFPSFESKEAADVFENFYLAFENRYRGSREEIKHRQKVYLPYLEKSEAVKSVPRNQVRIIDLGCGRGEWLELLHNEGYSAAVGVDLNAKMVEICKDLSLSAVHADGIEFLRGHSDHSVQVITSAHLIEHLPFPVLLKLFTEARRALVPGGLLILETPNCNNVLTATQNFPSDPTHRLPIPPILLSFAAEHLGFQKVQILPLHPYGLDYHVGQTTDVGRRFNDYFYGPQDYALIAQIPDSSSRQADV